MKRRIAASLLCIFMLGGGVGVSAQEAPAAPAIDAKGAIVMEFDTGRVLYEKDADVPLANASTTKIMTAIVALENSTLDEIVTASKKAATTPPVKMYLQEGEQQRMEDLLYALMLESANDAAVAIAEHVGGSVEGFADMMNQKAIKLGADNTVFVTPNGLDEGDHHTTARDLAKIARYAMANKDFQRIISTPAITTPSDGSNHRAHSFVNKDRLLREYEGAMGIKTGYTGKAGHCFVGAAKRNGMLIVSVALGSGWGAKGKEQKWVDTKRLLNYGFENYEYIHLAQEGTAIKTFEVLHSKGKNVNVRLAEDLSMPLTKAEKEQVEMKYYLPEALDAPIVKGEKIGTMEAYAEGRLLAQMDIIADKDIERHDFQISTRKILDALFEMQPEALWQ